MNGGRKSPSKSTFKVPQHHKLHFENQKEKQSQWKGEPRNTENKAIYRGSDGAARVHNE